MVVDAQLRSRSFERSQSRKRETPPQDEVLQSIRHGIASKADIKLVRKITKSGRNPDTEEELWGVSKFLFSPTAKFALLKAHREGLCTT